MPPTPHAHRDLIVGLVALQSGLIDQDHLLRAFHAWTLGKERPIAEILIEQGLTAEQREWLEADVAARLARHDGDLEATLAAIHADESTIEHLSKLDHPAIDQSLYFVSPSAAADAETLSLHDDRDAAARVGSTESDGTRYRVIRPHRRGGLGAVFVAVDAELHREVALKRILDEHADDPQTRQRFLIEAEITAGLEHPGIVPVYGLGVSKDGRPYYAMRFIKGDSLKEAIVAYHHRRSSSKPDPDGSSAALELNKLVRRFLDVCNAIAYAHKRGVFHRDIKPGNILIGKYGETLVVDWGLAKASGRSDAEPSLNERALMPSGSGSGETLPHTKIGTPAYMSPEQARGDLEQVGVHSDVYGLGASLYYLLAGRPPFSGRDVAAILDAVARGEFAPPRQVDPSIDPALEAICLKAMALRPEDRYDGPRDLADDLERWLADDPVAAYSEGWTRRIARWSRHHSSIVASAGVLLVAGLLGLGTIVGLVARQNARLREANDAITRERNRAEASGMLARGAIKEVVHEFAHSDLLNLPQGELVRLKMAERAARYIRELDGLKPSDPATLLDQAKILDEVASLYRMVGKYPESAAEFAEGIALVDRLLAADPLDPRYLDTQAHLESQLGELIRLRGGTLGEAEPHYRRAVALAGELRRIDPNQPNHAKTHATALNDLANALTIAARHGDAEPFGRDAVAAARVYRASLPETPDPAAFQMGYMILPMCRATYGEICLKLGRDGWDDHLARAIDEARQLLATYPTSHDAPFILVESSRILLEGKARDLARLDDALKAFDGHVVMIDDLAKNYPSMRLYQRYIARLRADRGALRLRAGLLDPAEDDLSFAHGRAVARVEAEKTSIPALRDLARVKAALARLAEKRGQPKLARDRIDEAIAARKRALAIEPGNLAVAQELADDETYARSLTAP